MLKQHRCLCLICQLLAILIVCATAASAALGAEVTVVSKKKRLVKIDEGDGSGFVKGAVVCFFKEEKKIACGKIRKHKADYALIKLSKKSIRKVKKGMEARLKEASASASGDTASGGNVAEHRRNFKLAYIITPMTPSTYNTVTYKAPEAGASQGTADTLYETAEPPGMALFGFAAEAEFGIGKEYALAFGLRYRMRAPPKIQNDYNKSESLKSKFAEREQSSTAMGFYSDFTYLDIPISPAIFFRASGGLDFEMSTMNFKATQFDDNTDEENEIASVTSKTTVVSLRAGANINFLAFEPVGMVLGLQLLIPAAAVGSSTSVAVDDSQVSYLEPDIDPEESLTDTIAHGKAGFGAEIIIATYFAF